MKTKEEWISETMESLDDIQPADGDPILAEKVMNRIRLQEPVVFSFRAPVVLRAAAAIVLLISFNLITFIYFAGGKDAPENNVKSIASEYFSYIDSLNL